MNYSKALFISILFCSIYSTLLPLSQEEKAMFDMISNLNENELQELIQTIDSEVNKMSPEEQKEFWNAVEAEASRLEPQIAQYMQEGQTPEPQPTPQKTEKKVAKKKKPVKKEKKKPSKDKDTLAAARTMLTNLLDAIDNVICIAQTIPQFDQEVEEWSDEGLLKNWQAGLTWSFFKDQVITLSHKLKLLTSQDAVEHYKYLELLLEDIALYNNIKQLQNKIGSTGELQACSLETEALSLESEQVMQSILSSLYEAINVLHVIGSIDALIAKYKPIAQELHKEELELQEQARRDESLLSPYRKPASAGKETGPTSFVGIPHYEPRPTSPPSYTDTSAKTQKTQQPSLLDIPKTTPQTPQQVPQRAGQKPTKAGTTPSTGTGTGKLPKLPPEKKESTDKFANKVADGYVKDLNSALTKATTFIEDAQLKGIKNQVLGRGAVNTDLVFYIPQITSQVKKAVTAAQTLKLRTKKFRGGQKAKYARELTNILKQHTPLLNGIAAQIREIRTDEARISDEKAYAYLGGKRKDKVPALVQKISNPANLYALENSIRELLLIK